MPEMIYFSAVTSLIFFILGGIIGWMGNDIVYATQQPEQLDYSHPEMYDANGAPYSGELLHVRFEEQEVEDED
tara:strand:- start:735 stop:953 length:219 start_codon:yes stop_codon:yes gene_type:complete